MSFQDLFKLCPCRLSQTLVLSSATLSTLFWGDWAIFYILHPQDTINCLARSKARVIKFQAFKPLHRVESAVKCSPSSPVPSLFLWRL
jgi:hypothetical protein